MMIDDSMFTAYLCYFDTRCAMTQPLVTRISQAAAEIKTPPSVCRITAKFITGYDTMKIGNITK